MIYLVWDFGAGVLLLSVPISSEVLIFPFPQNISDRPLIYSLQLAALDLLTANLFY